MLSGDMRRKSQFITLAKFIACLLIINSHCRDIYPLYFLAIGGAHGNSIFFIVSGYCLAMVSRPFFEWYKKRVVRIIPTTIFVLLLGVIIDIGLGYVRLDLWDLTSHFLDKYWFVWAILIYYFLFYFIFKKRNMAVALISLVLYFAVYVTAYFTCVDLTRFSIEPEGFFPFKVLFYFGVFLSGGLLRLVKEEGLISFGKPKVAVVCVSIAIASFALWAGEYYLVMEKQVAFEYQLVIQLCVLVFAIAIMVFGLAMEELNIFDKIMLPSSVIAISGATLEIYLVQVTVKALVTALVFPLNWVAFVASSVVGGILLRRAVTIFTMRK